MNCRPFLLILPTVLLLWSRPAAAVPQEQEIDTGMLQHLEWRCIGPATMGGRATDVEGVPGDPRVVYAAAASGGVWKTEDGGITWKPIFDDQPVASIGDIALEPGNSEVVYVGTGEANLRNTVSFGNGVYKSTDGGSTWRHLGLDDTRHIPRIVINPHNPAIVYVGAQGHAFGPNSERGVFMSTDGGENWEKVCYIDDRHGVSDLDINQQNPNILYAGFWHFERKPWTFTSGSEGGGVYKSVDGGRSWKKLEKGLPDLVGRIGVRVAPSNPRVVYVIAESNEGTVFRSDDFGETFEVVSREISLAGRGFYFAAIRVDPTDENRLYALAGTLYVSDDGGRNFRRISSTMHSDHHALWIAPDDPNRMWQGQDGGIGVSYNRGESWEYVDVLPFGQYYAVFADNRQPFYYTGGGLQDNATWYGPSRIGEPYGILNDDWREISNGDGFQSVVHPDDPELFLSEWQGGRLVRTDNRTREQQFITPYPPGSGGAPASEHKYRFNWNAPVAASPHDPLTVYFAGNVVFKSEDFGTTWQIISPDLTTNDPEKQKSAGGPIWWENTTAEYHCTIISLAESPAQPGLLWAGTDDGNLQLSRDGGTTWDNVIGRVRGMAPNSPVSHVEPSRTAPGTCYISFDRHMLDDCRPYIFSTSNFGRSWRDISGDLPGQAYVWVVREDPRNPNLIYAGTELGLYGTFDSGGHWFKLHLKNFPTVAVHDMIVHPRDNDLIVGTHGRGLWIFDDATPLQNLGPATLYGPAYLFDVRRAIRFAIKETRYGIGDKQFLGTNPPYGAIVTYYLAEEPAEDAGVKLEVMDETGQVIRTLGDVPQEAGLNRTAWDLRMSGPRPRGAAEAGEEAGRFGRARGPVVPPGTYQLRLTVGTETYQRPVEVVVNPAVDVTGEEIQRQFLLTRELRDMQSLINDALQGLDVLLEQVEERKKTVNNLREEVPEDLTEAIDEYIEQTRSLQNNLTRSGRGSPGTPPGPPRLMQKLGELGSSVDGVNARPTDAQQEYFRTLRDEVVRVISEVNEHFRAAADSLNAVLGRHGVPVILIPGPIALP